MHVFFFCFSFYSPFLLAAIVLLTTLLPIHFQQFSFVMLLFTYAVYPSTTGKVNTVKYGSISFKLQSFFFWNLLQIWNLKTEYRIQNTESTIDVSLCLHNDIKTQTIILYLIFYLSITHYTMSHICSFLHHHSHFHQSSFLFWLQLF